MIYVHKFIDIDKRNAEILSKTELTDMEWSIKENKYNIECLKYPIKEVNMMTKEDQLKKSFKMLLTTMLEAAKEEYFIGDLIDSYTNLLLKEVTIRTKL